MATITDQFRGKFCFRRRCLSQLCSMRHMYSTVRGLLCARRCPSISMMIHGAKVWRICDQVLVEWKRKNSLLEGFLLCQDETINEKFADISSVFCFLNFVVGGNIRSFFSPYTVHGNIKKKNTKCTAWLGQFCLEYDFPSVLAKVTRGSQWWLLVPWGGKTRVGNIGINPKVRDWHPWVVVANCTNRKIGSAGLKGDSFFFF